jgi:phosphoserine phosphatase
MVVFDLDGTLTPVISLWRYLHDAFGTWTLGEVAAQRYKRGEISYTEWAETDAKYWAGLQIKQVQDAINQIPFQKGVREVFIALKQKGVKIAILSAGLSILADKIASELGADIAVANELELDDGVLTGGVTVKVEVDEKSRIIEEIAKRFSIPIDQVALVGDRANDLCIPECLRIAFKPVDAVARNADFVVEDDDLSRILQYLD